MIRWDQPSATLRPAPAGSLNTSVTSTILIASEHFSFLSEVQAALASRGLRHVVSMDAVLRGLVVHEPELVVLDAATEWAGAAFAAILSSGHEVPVVVVAGNDSGWAGAAAVAQEVNGLPDVIRALLDPP